MKKFVYFLMFGLAFTVLQVATVEAEEPPKQPEMECPAGTTCGGPGHNPGGPDGHNPGGPGGHMGNPGCDPNLAPDAGGCPDGFQGKPHHDGPDGHKPGGPNDHHDNKGPNDHMRGGPNDHRGPGGPNDHHDNKGPNDHMRGGPNDHRGPGGPNDHHDGKGPNDHVRGGPNDHHDGPDCAAMHPGGAAAHVDPPQEKLDAIGAEMEASCKAGNCGISEATYASLTSLGHTRAEVDCFLAEGQARHDDGKGHHDGPPGEHHDGPPGEHHDGPPGEHHDGPPGK